MRQCVSLFTVQGLISSSIICRICSQIVPLGVFVHGTHNFWAGLLMVYNSDENFCFFILTPKEELYLHSEAAIALVSSCQALAHQLFVTGDSVQADCWHRPQFSTTSAEEQPFLIWDVQTQNCYHGAGLPYDSTFSTTSLGSGESH